jgi:hypothetical protein
MLTVNRGLNVLVVCYRILMAQVDDFLLGQSSKAEVGVRGAGPDPKTVSTSETLVVDA